VAGHLPAIPAPAGPDPTIGVVDPAPAERDPLPPSTPPAPTALPSVTARVVAFVVILLAGAAGGFIGYAFTDLQCRGDCTLQTGLGALAGAALAAGGTAVVTVLALRAMGEWRTIQAREAAAAEQPAPRPPRVR
jgi:hypothetical protein